MQLSAFLKRFLQVVLFMPTVSLYKFCEFLLGERLFPGVYNSLVVSNDIIAEDGR